MTFQLAKVNRALWSVSDMVKKGHTVVGVQSGRQISGELVTGEHEGYVLSPMLGLPKRL